MERLFQAHFFFLLDCLNIVRFDRTLLDTHARDISQSKGVLATPGQLSR